ncbi:malate dehydrogenase (quinone) [Aestuariirhabdus sp. Z084]|nr:malate dehydrogenase (quinone) [Aestuariirhabdus haliotis]MCL6418834.1 malate dehydrogenase (quinone) [Aestuariirhabdus haliotis]
MTHDRFDALLVGSGTMSATLATLLKELDPTLRIGMVERLDAVAQESTSGWNNAGTGHAAYCELNYTPESNDGVEIGKALSINAAFELSLQLWSYLVQQQTLPAPQHFINPTPHCSFVWGDDNVSFLKQRFEQMSQHHLFQGMEYSEDPETIQNWMPLVMDGRDPTEPVAATRMVQGADVDFGSLTRNMVDSLQQQEDFDLLLNHEVSELEQLADSRWQITLCDRSSGHKKTLNSAFVFLGAGGGTLPLLQKSNIPESKGYAGFPVSGQWLVCKDPETVAAHSAKVYGKAAIGAPPMSVPHLDTRVIDGQKALLFGPFAGFTTKFLKHGSLMDLPGSVRTDNLMPLTSVGINNLDLTRYLIKEALQSNESRMESLRHYLPLAKSEDWTLATAGQRVQVIKKDAKGKGSLEFGTEVVTSKDGSLAALMGASPGASIAVQAMLNVLNSCFKEKMQSSDWQQKMRTMIPSHNTSLIEDADHLRNLRPQTLETLGLFNANSTKKPADRVILPIDQHPDFPHKSSQTEQAKRDSSQKYAQLSSIKQPLKAASNDDIKGPNRA